MSEFRADLRFAFRQLRRSPGFTVTALLTLAVGIGLTAAMLSVTREALLAPLPYANPGQLVALGFGFSQERDAPRQVGAASDFLRRFSHSYTSFGLADGGASGVNVAEPGNGPGHAYPVQQLRVSGDFLPTLGIQPALGRMFTADEDRHGGPRAALLSDDLWRSRFHSDPAILGRLLRIDEDDVPIVGVLPAGVVADMQGGTRDAGPAGIFQPLQLDPKDPGYDGTNYQMIARLRDGVPVAQAQAELNALVPEFAQQNTWYKRWRLPTGELGQLRAMPLQTALMGDARSSLLLLLAAAGAVLLVACLNLAGLMVARTAARTRELAMRAALGASRGKLLRLMLAESALLAGAGAASGVVVARVVAKAFLTAAPFDLPHFGDAVPSVGPLAAAAAVLAGTAMLVFGLLPAVIVLRREVNSSLRSAGAQGYSFAYQRLGQGLIAAQVALAFVLVSAASLLLHTFLVMRSTNPGIVADRVTIGQVTLKGDAYSRTERNVRTIDRVVHRLRQTPGVDKAGAVNGLPLDRGLNMSGWPVGRKDLRHTIQARFVDRDYLAAIGIPILRGRGIGEQDGPASPRVAVISEAAAKRWWPDGGAIGSRINVGNETEYTVVGVARDTHESSLLDSPSVLVYVPLAQLSDAFTKIINGWFPTTFVVRSSAGVDVASAMQSALSEADPELPLARFETMQSVVDASMAKPRFFSSMSTGVSFFTLLLAAIGLFGLLSYQVTQRTREIGVRMALGATRGDVLASFLTRGFLLTVAGLSAGALLSLGLPRLLSSVLQEFAAVHTSAHALTYEFEAALFAALLLCAVALAACLVPARRASTVEPIVALRAE